MKKIICAVVVTGAAVLSLSACSTSSDVNDSSTSNGDSSTVNHDTSSDPSTFYVTLSNGNKVLCAGMNGLDGSNGAAPTTISCDWTDAQHLNKTVSN